MKRIAIALTLVMVLFSACQPVPVEQVPVKDLTADKAGYASQYKSFEFTHGVVVYLSEKEDFFVITGDETLSPDDFGDDDYIIVKYNTKDLAIGDILDIYASVAQRTVRVDDKSVEVQYLNPSWSADAVKKIGQVDITDPDFEKLITGIRKDIQDQTTTFLIIWMLFLNPASPLSPLHQNNFDN